MDTAPVGPDGELIGLLDRPGPAGGDRAALVMIHGWTGSKEDFAPVVGRLAEDRRVVVPDLPGCGLTPPGPTEDDHGIEPTARWVGGLLDRLGLGDVHLLGHSMGGLTAQALAHDQTHRVRSLALVGSGLGAPGEATAARILAVALAARDAGMAAAWEVVTGGGDLTGDPRATFVRDRFLGMTPRTVVGGARSLLAASPRGAFLRGLDVPALVCHGEGDDTWLPHEQRLLARTINGARYRVIPDALHSPAVENPDGLLAVLLEHLSVADDPHSRRSGRRARRPRPGPPAHN